MLFIFGDSFDTEVPNLAQVTHSGEGKWLWCLGITGKSLLLQTCHISQPHVAVFITVERYCLLFVLCCLNVLINLQLCCCWVQKLAVLGWTWLVPHD